MTKYFSQLQWKNSVNAYCSISICLVCYLAREQAFLQLPGPITRALDKLVSKETDGSLKPFIHKLLLWVWTSSWIVQNNDPVPDPTMRFVMCHQINRDGRGLKGPQDVTDLLIKIQIHYLMVCLQS